MAFDFSIELQAKIFGQYGCQNCGHKEFLYSKGFVRRTEDRVLEENIVPYFSFMCENCHTRHCESDARKAYENSGWL